MHLKFQINVQGILMLPENLSQSNMGGNFLQPIKPNLKEIGKERVAKAHNQVPSNQRGQGVLKFYP